MDVACTSVEQISTCSKERATMPDIIVRKGWPKATVHGNTPRGISWVKRCMSPGIGIEVEIPNDLAEECAQDIRKADGSLEVVVKEANEY